MTPVFPSLPTDNLYKFLALSGVVLIISSIYVMTAQVAATEDKMSELREVIEVAKRKSERFRAQADEYRARMENEISRMKREPITRAGPTVSTDVVELGKLVDENAFNLRVEQAHMVATNERMKLLIDRVSDNLKLSLLLSGVGSVLMLAGFFAWFWYVQRPLDVAARRSMFEPTNG